VIFVAVTLLSSCRARLDSVSHVQPTPTAAPALGLADRCTADVTFWVGRLLSSAPDPGLDYQEMGLVDATYNIVRAIVSEHSRRLSAVPQMDDAERARVASLCRHHYGSSLRGSPRAPGHTWPAG